MTLRVAATLRGAAERPANQLIALLLNARHLVPRRR